MRRGLSLWALVLLAAAVVSSCGDDDRRAVLLDPQVGRELRYEGTRSDRWDDPEFGYGGELVTTTRYRLTCIEAVAGRGGRYEVVVEGVRVASPPRFGVTIDTDTPDPEGEDEHEVEALARSLLNRRGELSLGLHAGVLAADPDPEIREALSAWAEDLPREVGTPVAILLDQILNGAPMAGSWSQAAGVLFPPEPYPAEGRSWTSTPPPAPSHAGPLEVALVVDFAFESQDVALMNATGEFHVATSAETKRPPALDFESGGIAMTVRVDTRRGVLLSFNEESRYVFRKKDEARTEMEVSQSRELRLLE
jgi:hypothetical protein